MLASERSGLGLDVDVELPDGVDAPLALRLDGEGGWEGEMAKRVVSSSTGPRQDMRVSSGGVGRDVPRRREEKEAWKSLEPAEGSMSTS